MGSINYYRCNNTNFANQIVPLKKGDIVEGDANEIHNVDLITILGNNNYITTNGSTITGDYNNVYGNNNYCVGNNNNMIGSNNGFKGINNTFHHATTIGYIYSLTDEEKLQQLISLQTFYHAQQYRLKKVEAEHNQCGFLRQQLRDIQQKQLELDQANIQKQHHLQQHHQQHINLLIQQQQQTRQQDSLLAQMERDEKDRLYRQLEVKVQQMEVELKRLAMKPISIDLTFKGKFPLQTEKLYDEKVANDSDTGLACVICLENKKNCLIRPCLHLSLCVSCSLDTHKVCPVCRSIINGIERVFY
jgi:hypothetical protein